MLGSGSGAEGGGGLFHAKGTYTRHHSHALPREKNTQALSFGASHRVYSNPCVPLPSALADDRTSQQRRRRKGGRKRSDAHLVPLGGLLGGPRAARTYLHVEVPPPPPFPWRSPMGGGPLGGGDGTVVSQCKSASAPCKIFL